MLPHSSQGSEPVATVAEQPEEIVEFGQVKAPRSLVDAVVKAAQVTGIDPPYMMAIADKESSLLPGRRARTSSAEGLFQFLEGTWVEALRRFGSKHGFSAAAEAIRVDRGRATVAEDKNRKWILSLRRDPYLSALMAGEMVNTHRQILTKKVARDPSFAELYFAHLMGVRGATRLVQLKARRPRQSARSAFPWVASANRSLFYGVSQSGKANALSVAELHGRVEMMIDRRLSRYAALR
jgi:hypothetical protein